MNHVPDIFDIYVCFWKNAFKLVLGGSRGSHCEDNQGGNRQAARYGSHAATPADSTQVVPQARTRRPQDSRMEIASNVAAANAIDDVITSSK